MTSPETPARTPAPEPPPRGIFGDGSWRGIAPLAAVLSIFLGVLGGMFTWLDSRITDGIDGVERRLTAQIVEVKADLSNRIDGVETRLNARIDQVEMGLNARIDRVETRLTDQIDQVKTELKAELAAREARRAAVDAQLSADIERVAAGVTENRAAHRELAGFVRASRSPKPSPATTEQGAAPAQ